MADTPDLTADERQQLVLMSRAIVDAAKYGQRIHLPSMTRIYSSSGVDKLYRDEVERMALQFAQLVVHYIDRLQFISLVSMTATQTAVQRMEGVANFMQTAMREIRAAALAGEFPEWWPEQRADAPVTR